MASSSTGSVNERLWTYFAIDSALGLSVNGIAPHGGSTLGGTRVTINGTGFNRGQGATDPECSFGESGIVPATMLSPEALACVSPPHAGNMSSSFAVEVGINRQEFTSDAQAMFTYSAPSMLSSIHPQGGHASGGTPLTISVA